jgi:hypothetical protein
MTAFTVICPYCGQITTVPGNSNGKLYLNYHCPVCDCLFRTQVKGLIEELHDTDRIYTTLMIKEGVLNKRKP